MATTGGHTPVQGERTRTRRIQIEPPSVPKHISRTLERYPDGQILKELIQNADDAEATIVKFCIDTRQHPVTGLIDPELSIFQGPALLAYNNAVFKDEDWEHFGKMENSGKETAALKVGRFGVGFLSVFHLTDLPLVISTDLVAMLDPHKRYTGSGKMGNDWDISEFLSYESHASCLEGIFDFDCSTTYYHATLFRFPLRNKDSKSDIKENEYPHSQVRDNLYKSFIEEAPIIMLFLKYVQEISLYENDRLVYKVSIDPSHSLAIKKEREVLLKKVEVFLQSTMEDPDLSCLLSLYSMSITTEDYREKDGETISPKKEDHHWLVMNIIGSNDCEIYEMSREQKNVPWVGIASPLPQKVNIFNIHLEVRSNIVKSCISQLEDNLKHNCLSSSWVTEAKNHLEGRAFCFLPLPFTINLPVHIHGYFAVSDNRRSIEWPTSDNKSNKAIWNKKLLDKHIPSLYSMLLACRTYLVTYTDTPLPEQDSENLTDPYMAWPLFFKVNGNPIWMDLAPLVIEGIENLPILWTAADGGKWVRLNEAYYLPTETTFPLTRAAIDVLIKANCPVVSLPYDIRDTLVECNLEEILIQRTIEPALVRRALKQLNNIQFNDQSIVEDILECILYDIENKHDCSELVSLKLLPIATQLFETVCFQEVGIKMIKEHKFVIPTKYEKVLEFLPGIEKHLVSRTLRESIIKRFDKLASMECLQLRLLTSKIISTYLLEASMKSCFSQLDKNALLKWSPGQNGHPPIKWIIDLWTWLHKESIDLSDLEGLPLIPDIQIDNIASSSLISLLPLVENGGRIFFIKDNDDKFESDLASLLQSMNATIVQYNQCVFSHPSITKYHVLSINVDNVLRYIQKIGIEKAMSCLKKDQKVLLRSLIASAYFHSISLKSDVIKKLPIFEAGVGKKEAQLVNLNGNYILPDYHNTEFDSNLIFPSYFLNNSDDNIVRLLKNLGLKVVTKDKLILDHILPFARDQIQSSLHKICNGDLLIIWILNNASNTLLCNLKNVPAFLRTKADKSKLEHVTKLYDYRDEEFRKLFDAMSDPVFPNDWYYDQGVDLIDKLLKMGLNTWKGVLSSPHLKDFIIERAESVRHSSRKVALARSAFILSNNDLMEHVRNIKFLAVQTSRLSDYPTCLNWAGTKFNFEAPINMCSNDINTTHLIGSILPILANSYTNVPPQVVKTLFKEIFPSDVTRQLVSIVGNVKRPIVNEKLTEIINNIYHYLNENNSGISLSQLPKDWIWWPNEQGQYMFLNTSRFVWSFNFSLSPFIYRIKEEKSQFAVFENLFVKIGGLRKTITTKEVVQILKKIAMNFGQQKLDEKYISMVTDIVKYLQNNKYESNGDIYLPTTDNQLILARECTYDDREWVKKRVGTRITKYKFVHENIPPNTAHYFGVEPLSNRIAPSKKLQLTFTQAGPNERITRRINGIVNDYSGNIDVFKEIIQNADDASASEIKLLVDWRQHGKEYLFDDEMAHWQGPAVIAYNNAIFSDQDFKNICDLAAETKMKDPMKTGRFGVGFCSCYSLTDVPSFVSRHFMTIFDPHTKYLGERISNNAPGMRINLVDQLEDLHVYEHQFAPFDGLFGCDIFNLEETGFNGTIFRFPLRMKSHPRSEIFTKLYNEGEIDYLIEELKKEADNLLIFLKNIHSLELYVLDKSAKSPQEMKLRLKVEKSSPEHNSRLKLIRKPQDEASHCSIVSIDIIKDEETSTSKHLVSTAVVSGGMADTKTGLIPLAELSIRLPLSDLITTTKHYLFCFLPLPISSSLLFHVNGFFDVGKDRRSLKEADQSPEYKWNESLIKNVLPLALKRTLLKLTQLIDPHKELHNYYSLWPGDYNTGRRNWITETFSISAMKTLSCSEECLLWSQACEGKWVSMKNCYLFVDFICEEEIKLEAIELILSKGYNIVECPNHVQKLLKTVLDESHLLNYQWFFTKIFIPNISNINELLRDRHLLFVLKQIYVHGNQHWAYDVIKTTPCIPTKSTAPGHLVCPCKLIDVNCKPIANLYEESEGRFPTEEYIESSLHSVLISLGMITKELPIESLVERAESISSLTDDKAHQRIIHLIHYIKYIENLSVTNRFLRIINKLSSSDVEKSKERIKALNKIPFLPSLSKPDDNLLIPWYNSSDKAFHSPSELYSPCFTPLVFSVQPILHVPINDESTEIEKIAKYLGIDENKPTLSVVLDHLLTLIKSIDGENESVKEFIEKEKIFSGIYKFLNEQIKDDNNKEIILSKLCETCCIWEKGRLLNPQQVLYSWNAKECFPYYCPLSETNKSFKDFFIAIGVKEVPSFEYLISLLQNINKDYNGVPLPKHILEFVINSITFELYYLTVKKDKSDILLPDQKGILCPSSMLSSDPVNEEWIVKLPVYDEFKSKGGRSIHSDIPRDRAIKLGSYGLLESILKDIEDEAFLIGTDYGQEEDLVVRLNGILKKYPANTSIFREFIQNADDAQATEIVFVLDHRTNHGQNTLLHDSSNWKSLQRTPALCIYNNRQFTEEDIQGICKLGRGGKGDTSDTIGRFGIGFNVSYHMTDCPTFVSFNNKSHPQDLCVFDPLRRYCTTKSSGKPGRRWKVEEKHLQFPDQFRPFLIDQFDLMKTDCFKDKSNGFVVFRLPLIRYNPNYGRASYSLVNNSKDQSERWLKEGNAHTVNQVKTLMKEFESSSENMLLFLNHIKSISVFEIAENGDCQHHFTSSATICSSQSKVVKQQSLTHNVISITHQVNDGDNVITKWLISKRCDFSSALPEILSKGKERGLEPFGGVATQISPIKLLKGYLFNFLPITIPSCLPVHLNAHFLVDDSRRHLESLPDLTNWNQTVAEHVLVPAYIELLLEARNKVECSTESIEWYYNLFPKLPSSDSSEASQLNIDHLLFKKLLEESCPILLDERQLKENETINWLTLDEGQFCINHIDGHHFIRQAKEVEPVLVSLHMPITCTPIHIFDSLIEVSLKYKERGIMTPYKVLKWLKSIDVKEYKTIIITNCKLLLEFCLQASDDFCGDLKGVPLLLTMDNTLCSSGELYESQFSDLLPHLKTKFINRSLEESIIGKRLTTNKVITSLLVSYVSSCIRLENCKEEVELSKDKIELVSLLWSYFEHVSISYDLLTQCFDHKPILPASNGLFYPLILGKCLYLNNETKFYVHVKTTLNKLGYNKLDLTKLRCTIVKPSCLYSLITDSLITAPTSKSDLLKCLKLRPPSNATNVTLTKDEVTQLISLLSSDTEKIPPAVVVTLKKLPLFETVDGTYIRLSKAYKFYIKPVNIPVSGIITIQNNIGEVVLDNPGHQTDTFYKNIFTEKEYEDAKGGGHEFGFYLNFLITHFSHLSESELEQHLLFIKQSCQKVLSNDEKEGWIQVMDKLKNIPLIGCETKERQLVSSFYNPNIDFNCIFQKNKLPPEKWCTSEWLPFLKLLDLQCKTDKHVWLSEAKKFGEEVKGKIETPSESLVDKSTVLLTTFKTIMQQVTVDTTDKEQFIQFLSDSSRIPFIYSKPCELLQNVEIITSVPTNNECEYFICFQNAVYYDNSDLACMTSHVLPKSCQFLKKMASVSALSIKEPINIEGVVQNLKTLCEVLSCVKTFVTSPEKTEAIRKVKIAIEQHYSYMEKYSDEKTIQDLLNSPCIILSTHDSLLQLVKPTQLVMRLPQGFNFRPFCYDVPSDLMKYTKLLNILKIKKELEPLQLIDMLSKIKQEMENSKIKKLSDSIQFKNICISVYRTLIKQLRLLTTPPRFPSNVVIYLPTESMDELVKSTELVHNDTPWIAMRLKNKSVQFNYKFLLPPEPDDKGQKLPPAILGVKLLSKLAVEKIHPHTNIRENCCTDQELYINNQNSANCNAVQVIHDTIRSPDFTQGIERLYWHRNQRNPKTDEIFCNQLQILTQVKIICVSKIKTIIVLEDNEIEGTENDFNLCHLVNNTDNQLQLYITHEGNEDSLFEELAQVIGAHFSHVTGDSLNIKSIFKCEPCQIQEVLDKLHISPFDLDSCEKGEMALEQKVGLELSISAHTFTPEELLIVCNYDTDEIVLYDSFNEKGQEVLKFAKIVECPMQTDATLKDMCVKIQTGTNDEGDPIIISVSLLQIYKQLDASQLMFLKEGQCSPFISPLTFASVPNTLDEIEKWLKDIIVYNNTHCFCSESQLSLRLTAHLHYVLKNSEKKEAQFFESVETIAEIIERESTSSGSGATNEAIASLVNQLENLSLEDDEALISLSPPSNLSSQTFSNYNNSRQRRFGRRKNYSNYPPYYPSPALHSNYSNSSHSVSPTPHASISSLHSTTSLSHNAVPSQGRTSLNRLPLAPTAGRRGGGGISTFHRPTVYANNFFANRIFQPDAYCEEVQKPLTDMKKAKMWLLQGKTDYLSAIELWNGLNGDSLEDLEERTEEVHTMEDDIMAEEDVEFIQDEKDDEIKEGEKENNDMVDEKGKEPEKEKGEDKEDEEEEEEEVKEKSPKKEETTCKFPALVCFLCHDMAEKCIKGFMYAKCGLPEVLLEEKNLISLKDEIKKSKYVPKNMKALLEECALQINEHGHKSRYPHYQIPPCAPATVYTLNDASNALRAAKKLIHNLSQDDKLCEIIGNLSDLPEPILRISLLNTGENNLPDFWAPHDGDEKVKLVLLNTSLNEFCRVAMLFQSSLPNYTIKRIDRIQNKLLWGRYVECAKRTSDFNNGDAGEKLLFHGTSENKPCLIYEGDSSFDMRFCDRGYWGIGNYFAVNASYSDNYAHDTPMGYCQILVASVLTGLSYESPRNGSLRQPPDRPEKQGGILPRYDSVSGDTGGSKVYITYDNERAYPMYLITYHRR